MYNKLFRCPLFSLLSFSLSLSLSVFHSLGFVMKTSWHFNAIVGLDSWPIHYNLHTEHENILWTFFLLHFETLRNAFPSFFLLWRWQFYSTIFFLFIFSMKYLSIPSQLDFLTLIAVILPDDGNTSWWTFSHFLLLYARIIVGAIFQQWRDFMMCLESDFLFTIFVISLTHSLSHFTEISFDIRRHAIGIFHLIYSLVATVLCK